MPLRRLKIAARSRLSSYAGSVAASRRCLVLLTSTAVVGARSRATWVPARLWRGDGGRDEGELGRDSHLLGVVGDTSPISAPRSHVKSRVPGTARLSAAGHLRDTQEVPVERRAAGSFGCAGDFVTAQGWPKRKHELKHGLQAGSCKTRATRLVRIEPPPLTSRPAEAGLRGHPCRRPVCIDFLRSQAYS